MFLAIAVLSVYHPGKVLQGVNSDFKAQDQARKADKKAKKQAKKDSKKRGKQYTPVEDGSQHNSGDELV